MLTEENISLVVDYLGELFYRGNEYNERGERQLMAYLDYFHQKKGYLLSFNFNVLTFGDKTIVEAVV